MVNGSLAANRVVAVADPAYSVMYVDEPEKVADALGMFPTDNGARVALLPATPARVRRAIEGSGLRWAAPVQVSIACMGGNGRMPAEGDALARFIAGPT